MSLEKRMKGGLLYCESGHRSEEDREYERQIDSRRRRAKELVFDYNRTRPSEDMEKQRILRKLLARMGEAVWMEAPIAFAYGCNTHIGSRFYSNFNLCIVDDCDVFIGDYVMLGPNVTLTATGHPVWSEYRRRGAQFSLPITIGNDVWIGANTVVLPGVTIGENTVIGAGSVVTRDIPAHTVAFGSPCRAVREITEWDRTHYRKGFPLNRDWVDG